MNKQEFRDSMMEVYHDVKIEPKLLPIENEPIQGNVSDGARLDVSGVGVWGAYEKTFLEIRIMHPNCTTYQGKSIPKLYSIHEKEKKDVQ